MSLGSKKEDEEAEIFWLKWQGKGRPRGEGNLGLPWLIWRMICTAKEERKKGNRIVWSTFFYLRVKGRPSQGQGSMNV